MRRLGKCAKPGRPALFRKLGSNKLFAFESVTSAKSVDITIGRSNIKTRPSPVFCRRGSEANFFASVGAEPDVQAASKAAQLAILNAIAVGR